MIMCLLIFLGVTFLCVKGEKIRKVLFYLIKLHKVFNISDAFGSDDNQKSNPNKLTITDFWLTNFLESNSRLSEKKNL